MINGPTASQTTSRSKEATASGLLKVVYGKIRLGVDSTASLDLNGGGRKSVRLESKDEFSEGLLVVDFEKMPGNTCGMWPALYVTLYFTTCCDLCADHDSTQLASPRLLPLLAPIFRN